MAVTLPADYWASYERVVDSLPGFFDAVRKISAYEKATDTRFAWRGVAKADWGLHSSLVRSYQAKHRAEVPLEGELREYERRVIDEARDWGLDWHVTGGRLAALELLAALQHYSVPTRLLDFTFNPFIALWFAVEKEDSVPGRVFAIDIAGQAVSRGDAAKAEPWWLDEDPRTDAPWSTQPWLWEPPPLEPRMVRQDGCFLMGGVPSTQPQRNVRDGDSSRFLYAEEVRICMSVPLVLISYDQAEAAYEGRRLPGAEPKARAFTLGISGDKQELRAELDRMLGLRHQSLFPDFPGLAEFGASFR